MWMTCEAISKSLGGFFCVKINFYYEHDSAENFANISSCTVNYDYQNQFCTSGAGMDMKVVIVINLGIKFNRLREPLMKGIGVVIGEDTSFVHQN